MHLDPDTVALERLASIALLSLGADDPDRARRLLDETGVNARDFCTEVAPIAQAAETVLRNGRAPEPIEIAKLARLGAPAVGQLFGASGPLTTWMQLKQQLESVREKSQRRQLLATLDHARHLVADCTKDYETAVSVATSALLGASEARGIRRLSTDLLQLVDRVDQVRQGNLPGVLATTLAPLDAIIGGLQPTLTVIGAAPGVGKSALLATILLGLALKGVVSALLSLEDPGEWPLVRHLAQMADVPAFVIAFRQLGDQQFERFQNAAERLYPTVEHVMVEDRSGLTIAQVIASARAMVARGAKAVFVDHLGEVGLDRSDRHDLDIADALRDLRALAKTSRVPVVVLAHMKRESGEQPKLTDFAFSAAVERMARVALALTRPDEKKLRVHVLKQTQGVSGVQVDLEFDPPAGLVKP